MAIRMGSCLPATAALLALIQTTADAQSLNGAFDGRVTDPGGALPGAKAQAKNLPSFELRQANTYEKGFYPITGMIDSFGLQIAMKTALF